jgi:hypothetical protein
MATCNVTFSCFTWGFGPKAFRQWLIIIEDTKEGNFAAVAKVPSSNTRKTQTKASKCSMCGMSTRKSKGKRFNLRIEEKETLPLYSFCQADTTGIV